MTVSDLLEHPCNKSDNAIKLLTSRVLARILDLGRVSNDQGVHMSIALNSKITVLVMLANNNACGCSILCNQIQGEHTLILRTDIKILSYTRIAKFDCTSK